MNNTNVELKSLKLKSFNVQKIYDEHDVVTIRKPYVVEKKIYAKKNKTNR